MANEIILGTSVLPANECEHEATGELFEAVARHGDLARLDIDRGSLLSDEIGRLHSEGIQIYSRRKVVSCPAGATAAIPASGRHHSPQKTAGAATSARIARCLSAALGRQLRKP